MADEKSGLKGSKVIMKNGDKLEQVDTGKIFEENDVIGFYFSAHWCPPCKGFTPMLIDTYNNLQKEGKKFEVVFVSSDMSQEEFDHYFGTMPWKAVEFGSDAAVKLGDKYGVRGIPTLVLLNKDGSILREDGRMVVHKHRERAFPFDDKTVDALEKT